MFSPISHQKIFFYHRITTFSIVRDTGEYFTPVILKYYRKIRVILREYSDLHPQIH